jgi:hypothetical protein
LCLLVMTLLLASSSPLAQRPWVKAASPNFLKPRPELSARLPDRLVESPGRVPIHPPAQNGFPQLARSAGMIFWGTVSRIERRPAVHGQSLETVAITFHIENALRGATRGRDITISQWAGVWSSGQRYRLGERVLLFLYPRSKLGLTSVVAGSLGRFEVDSWNRVVLSARHSSLFQADPILGGKSRVPFSDFALAVRQAGEEERTQR